MDGYLATLERCIKQAERRWRRRRRAMLLLLVTAIGATLLSVTQSIAFMKEQTDQVSNYFLGATRYTLSYDDNVPEEEIAVPPTQRNYGAGNFILSDTVPSRTGYKFLGWNTDPAGGGEARQPGEPYTTEERHTTFYAQWELDNYVLIYHANNGTEDTVRRESPDEPVFTIEDLPTLGITHGGKGKIFMGWADEANAPQARYGYQGQGVAADGTARTDLAASVTVPAQTREKHVYALWTTRYALSFDANAKYGGAGTVPDTQVWFGMDASHTFGIPAAPNPMSPYREGRSDYVFEKWALTEDRLEGEDPDHYQYGEYITLTEAQPEQTLWARYQAKQPFALLFDANLPSGVKASNMPLGVSSDGTNHIWQFVLPNNKPTAPNRNFRGWARQPDAATPDYQPGELFEQNRDVDYKVTLYAVWQDPHKFSVTFYANGEGATLSTANFGWYGSETKTNTFSNGNTIGVTTSGELDVKTRLTYTRKLQAGAVRKGYRLLGWAYDPDATTPDFAADRRYYYSSLRNQEYDYWYVSSDNFSVTITDEHGEDCPGGETHNVDLYAVWAPQHRFRIDFDRNYQSNQTSGGFTLVGSSLGGTQDENGMYYALRTGDYGSPPCYYLTQYLDPTVESVAVSTKIGVRMTNNANYNYAYGFLGWSENKDAAEPDPKYALKADGTFQNPIILTHNNTTCVGGLDGDDIVTHRLTLYAVWEPLHRFGVAFHKGSITSSLSPTGTNGPYFGGTRGWGSSNVWQVYTVPQSLTEKTYTLPAGTGLNVTATGYKILGWSENPNATAPDDKWALDANGCLLNDVVLGGHDDTCQGEPIGMNKCVEHLTHLYPVVERLHSFGINFKTGVRTNLLGTAFAGGGSYYDNKWSADIPTTQNIVIGTDTYMYASREDKKFLGWSRTQGAAVPDDDLYVDANGYLVTPVTLTDPDPNCQGGNVRHITELWPVWEDLHAWRLNFHDLRGASYHYSYRRNDTQLVKSTPDGWTTGSSGSGDSMVRTMRTEYIPTGTGAYTIPGDYFGYTLGNSDQGYVFLGWSRTRGATAPDQDLVLNGDGLFAGDVVLPDPGDGALIHDVDLYAVWGDAHRVRLAFQLGDGTSMSVEGAFSKTDTEQLLNGPWLSASEHEYTFPVRSFTAWAANSAWPSSFKGWSRDPNATEPEITSSGGGYYYNREPLTVTIQETNCAPGTVHEVKLYPVFQVKYTLTYDANGGLSNTVPAKQEYTDVKPIGADHTFPIYDTVTNSNPPVRSRFKFMGWSTEKTAPHAVYGYQNTDNEAIGRITGELSDTITLTPTQTSATLYAVWWYEYKLIYDANGGTGAPAAAYSYSSANTNGYDLAESVPTRVDPETGASYRFLGWAEKSDATVAQYQPGDKIQLTGGYSGYTEKTIYAVWALPGAAGQTEGDAPERTTGEAITAAPWESVLERPLPPAIQIPWAPESRIGSSVILSDRFAGRKGR